MPLLWTLLILKENSNVAENAVVNASPLIFLSRARLIDLLQLISAEVIVPESVATEIELEVRAILLHMPWPILLGLWLIKHLQYRSNPSLGIRTRRIFGARVGAFPSRFRGHHRRFSSSQMRGGT